MVDQKTSFIDQPPKKILKGDLDLWDFVLRKLFVLKATNLEKCLNTKYGARINLFARDVQLIVISALGPGSRNLIPKLTDGILSKDPRGLTLDDWKMVVQEFKNWPFRPEVSILCFKTYRK